MVLKCYYFVGAVVELYFPVFLSQAELQVADGSLSACLVLWNTVCLDWYRCLQAGQVLRLSRYRIKESYSSRNGHNAESNIGTETNPIHPSHYHHH